MAYNKKYKFYRKCYVCGKPASGQLCRECFRKGRRGRRKHRGIKDERFTKKLRDDDDLSQLQQR